MYCVLGETAFDSIFFFNENAHTHTFTHTVELLLVIKVTDPYLYDIFREITEPCSYYIMKYIAITDY